MHSTFLRGSPGVARTAADPTNRNLTSGMRNATDIHESDQCGGLILGSSLANSSCDDTLYKLPLKILLAPIRLQDSDKALNSQSKLE